MAVNKRACKAMNSYVTLVGGKTYLTDEWTNVRPGILSLVGRNLHKNSNHPIGILRELIESRFKNLGYTFYNDFDPVVSVHDNFDVLGFPKDHPGRSRSDTYYINKDLVLRTHTSAHEPLCFKNCSTPGYFISGDVYRKDEIDRTHYPVFHQLEGGRLWSRESLGDSLVSQIESEIAALPKLDIIVEDDNPIFDAVQNPKQDHMSDLETKLITLHLKKTIEILVDQVFNEAKKAALETGSNVLSFEEPLRVRWLQDRFPWTTPSWQIEVWWNGSWLECCGCGIVKNEVLLKSGIANSIGWAFGIGLDRIAMLLFGVPDIRLFWSNDDRFKKQFSANQISVFRPYSKYPGSVRDISFWLPEKTMEASALHENDLMEIVREVAGDLAESVKLIDEFVHPRTGKRSQCYRVNYQSMDRSLITEEVNALDEKVREALRSSYNIELR
ncbi:hypothetical protein KL921_002797 [Ogataea angusta]|uniref:Phenylalanine--tRNA ligase, mitochondrial n=1 Tax=Pichia angusta TaxID=870730 RepID=A0AAN6I4N9_PICAN|nr:uncharacterized protein KL928_003033 [Ogataea angusta]KAG7810302.1 hypothetical protein KL921_002797 [Ogataea angusta]KAG7818032.1 hypothetical protein KL928_003033 [Ogataea angusta]KAG7824483.1 hypothetical protein KL909_001705 [Ogataea angusta]KAG7828940.1 hypothetical protein KL920_002733 [Ogataea angusta]KAG7834260.1 hypothetical protein KL943_003556 [Ogataea angusta]